MTQVIFAYKFTLDLEITLGISPGIGKHRLKKMLASMEASMSEFCYGLLPPFNGELCLDERHRGRGLTTKGV